MESILQIKNLTHTYGVGTPFQRSAVEDMSFDVFEGEFLGIIGHTGSGKSTLATLLNGLRTPTAGEILLDGKNIHENPKELRKIRSRVGLVFQYPEYQLFEETVYADIAFGPKNMGRSSEEIDRMVRFAARFAGVEEELFEQSPFDLSGGQKRRVAIAGVMAMDPDVIVFDEPAAGLDPGGRDAVFTRIREYQRHNEKTVIVISHSMEDMARFGDELLVLKDGRVLMHDSVERVFAHSEVLKASGLRLPEITSLMVSLKEAGVEVDPGVYTVDDAYREIISRIKR